MSDDQQVSPDAFAALQANFKKQSQKAQAYYTAMHAMCNVLKSDDAASSWMEAPLDALGGKTPAEAIGAGMENAVLAYIGGLTR